MDSPAELAPDESRYVLAAMLQARLDGDDDAAAKLAELAEDPAAVRAVLDEVRSAGRPADADRVGKSIQPSPFRNRRKLLPGASAKAQLRVGNEYEVLDASKKVIGILHVIGEDVVSICRPDDGSVIKQTTIARAEQSAKEKGHTFRLRR